MPGEDILEKPLAEMKKEVGKVMGAVEDFKSEIKGDYDKLDVLTKEKIEKIEKSVTESLENIQKSVASHEKKQEELEAALNRAEQGGEDKALAEERAKAMSDFMRCKDGSAKKELEIITAKYAEQKAMSTDVNPDGGYLVRDEFGDFVANRIFETSPIRRLANVETIGANSLKLLIDDQEAGAGWVGQGGTISETATPELGELEIVAHKLYAEPKATTEMLEDAFLDVESWLQRKVAEKFSRLENTAFVTGNGVAQPRGIMSYSAWAAAGTYERNKLEQINSGNASALTADGIIDLQNSLIEDYQANATFLMRRATFGKVMKLKDGNGQYLFNMALDMNTGLPTANLLSRPVVFGSDVAAVAANALAIAYGDFRLAYTIVDRLGISILRDPYTAKGFVKFFTVKRTGGGVSNFDALKIQKIAA